jgi:hypothetical protein
VEPKLVEEDGGVEVLDVAIRRNFLETLSLAPRAGPSLTDVGSHTLRSPSDRCTTDEVTTGVEKGRVCFCDASFIISMGKIAP